MTVEITLKSTIDPTYLDGDFLHFINELNLAAVQGKQYVIATERCPDGTLSPVAFETRNITRVREIDDMGSSDALIGR